MTLDDKIGAFSVLGKFMQQFHPAGFVENIEVHSLNARFAKITLNLIETINEHNPWFTPEFVNFAFSSLGSSLEEQNIKTWLSSYSQLYDLSSVPLDIGVIMAGNLPLVGFHDFISVLFSGNKIVARLSTKDDKLLPAVSAILTFIEPGFKDYIFFEDNLLNKTDAVIATGSDNSAKYFEYYFRKQPHIIRKNRNSTAIITGEETPVELKNLADDIFLYFGLGCRNVSKLFLPGEYRIPDLLDQFNHYAYLYNHSKYANNYDYHRAIFLINRDPHYDTGFLLVKEDGSYSSPVGCIYYEYYKSPEDLTMRMEQDSDMLQCIVSNSPYFNKRVEFGASQKPMLWDYADNMDTIKFLLNLSQK